MSDLNKAVTWGFGLGCGCLLLLLFLFFGFMIFGAIIAPRVIDPQPVKPAVQQDRDRVDLKKESSADPIKPREEVERKREEQPKTTQDETKAPEAPARNEAQSAVKEFACIEKGVTSNLREAPNGTKTLAKIPPETRLEIISKREVRSGVLEV